MSAAGAESADGIDLDTRGTQRRSGRGSTPVEYTRVQWNLLLTLADLERTRRNLVEKRDALLESGGNPRLLERFIVRLDVTLSDLAGQSLALGLAREYVLIRHESWSPNPSGRFNL